MTHLLKQLYETDFLKVLDEKNCRLEIRLEEGDIERVVRIANRSVPKRYLEPGSQATDLVSIIEASSQQLEASSRGRREGSCPPAPARKRRPNEWTKKAPLANDPDECKEEEEEEKRLPTPGKQLEGGVENSTPQSGENNEDEEVFYYRDRIKSLNNIEMRGHFNYYYLLADVVRDVRALC